MSEWLDFSGGWNYRLISYTNGIGERLVGIYEVHYNKDGETVACTENPVELIADSQDELNTAWQLMGEAFEQPILDMDALDEMWEQAREARR